MNSQCVACGACGSVEHGSSVELGFVADLPRSDLVAKADQQQVASHLEPAPHGRDLRSVDLLPRHCAFRNRNSQRFRLVQQVDVERPAKREAIMKNLLELVELDAGDYIGDQRSTCRLRKTTRAVSRVKSLKPHCVSLIERTHMMRTRRWKPFIRKVRKTDR